MKAKVKTGKIVYRKMENSGGTYESEEPFRTLDELFSQVLDTDDPSQVDRIVITGEDDSGEPQVVTLVFQSITDQESGTT